MYQTAEKLMSSRLALPSKVVWAKNNPQPVYLPCTQRADIGLLHMALMQGLKNSGPVMVEEDPIYFATFAKSSPQDDTQNAQTTNSFSLVTRTVFPSIKRLEEPTQNNTSVGAEVNLFLGSISAPTDPLFFMLAGVANVNPENKSSGDYTLLQIIRYLYMLQQAYFAQKSLVVASTARSVNAAQTIRVDSIQSQQQGSQLVQNQAPSSLELLEKFHKKYLHQPVKKQRLGTMNRVIPTELVVVYIPQEFIPMLFIQLHKNLASLKQG